MRKAVRYIVLVIDILQISCIFHGMMLITMQIKPLYKFFRTLAMGLAAPVVFSRIFYLPYIIAPILIVLYCFCIIQNIKSNIIISRKLKIFEIVLWIIYIIEMIFLENLFLNLLWF